jgi:hypothetical protein
LKEGIFEMATEEIGSLSFASWIRQGLATAVETPAGPSSTTTIRIAVTFKTGENTTEIARPQLTLVGPGDIVGLDSRVVVRVWPKQDENDAEFENFALIEFDQADLPWRYTPTSEDGSHRLLPWFNLVVIDEDADKAILSPPTPTVKQAVLTVSAQVLPDLTQSWAWAHTQFEGATLDETTASTQIKGRSGHFVSRVICPRILQSNKRYLACLVPTFMRGRRIGTGTKPDEHVDARDLAWPANSAEQVDLPVYYSWRFQTGSTGSFEQLARLIEPRDLPTGFGRRKLDVHDPGLDLGPAASASMDVEGALQSPQEQRDGPAPWSDADRDAWLQKITPFVNAQFDGQKVVVPPLYGRWYAAQQQLNDPTSGGTNQPWFFQLNSDPRNRVGAGLGTLVIQNEQQALMASAWKQVGELDAINDGLRVGQLGRAVLGRMFEKHVLTGFTDTFWTMTAGLHAFVECDGPSVCKRLDGSPVDPWVFDPVWRRISRPRGRIARRQGQAALGSNVDSKLIDRLNQRQAPAPEPPVPAGLFTLRRAFGDVALGGWLSTTETEGLLGLGPNLRLFWGLVLLDVARKLLVEQAGSCWWLALKLMHFAIGLLREEGDLNRRIDWINGKLTCTELKQAPTAPHFAAVNQLPATIPFPPLLGGGIDHPDAKPFRDALCQIVDVIGPSKVPVVPPKDPIDLEHCRLRLTVELHPSKTVVARLGRFFSLDPDFAKRWHPKDPLEPIQDPPEYEQPMYAPLGEISKDWIAPALDDVARNSACVAETNQRFVEAYMAGLNDEMTRELLWNEFPTDQRGTYFRQFWDIAGVVPERDTTVDPKTQRDLLRDIRPVASWNPTGALGANSPRSGSEGERLVLLLRAQLVQRYPDMIVYLQKATFNGAGGHDLPKVDDDPTHEKHPAFYGILRPDVGFYGFDVTPEEVRGSSSDPGWFFILAEHPGEPKFHDVGPTPADATAAVVAQRTFRDPFRLAIHGSLLVAATGG